MTIGILSFQGDFERHRYLLESLGVRTTYVRRPKDVVVGKSRVVDGLVIPGGESTTISKLMDRFGISEAVRIAVADGMGVLGTCAGAILLATEVHNHEFAPDTPRPLELLDIGVERNAYGRQLDSFEAEIRRLHTEADAAPVMGVFIRAPKITRVGNGVEVLGEFESSPVWVARDKMVAATFHPELIGEARVHRFFLDRL